MNPWHDIDEKRVKANDFVAVIEISAGSKNKYELDKETGLLKLDRILYTSTHYPSNYGFIPKTLGDDNDPLDVLVLCSQAIQPLTLVKCYPIGVIKMIDQDRSDDKIIAICQDDPMYNCYKSLDELPKHMEFEIKHFFEVYKSLEKNKVTHVQDAEGKEKAIKVIQDAIDNYKKTFNTN